MIFDTDVLIWIQRGNTKAARWVEKAEERLISVYTYMELMHAAQNKKQHEVTKGFLKDFEFTALPLTENIGHRAAIYLEEYTLAHGLCVGDAIIAASATENHLTLCSGNARHFKVIKDLQLKVFKP